MKSWQVHYANKYPGGYCEASDHSFKVYDGAGKLRVCLTFGGDGQWHDRSEEFGLSDRHDLSPIPKDSRVKKVVDGKIVDDEKAAERKELAKKFLSEDGSKVLSCKELSVAKKFSFDDKQRVESL